MAEHPIQASDGLSRTQNQADAGLETTWRALFAGRAGSLAAAFPRASALTLGHGAAGGLREVAADSPAAVFVRGASNAWKPAPCLDRESYALAALYLDVCAAPDSPYLVGHLGQSLDGFVATESGDSDFVTGPENILHLHRMRALCAAVIVGASTVRLDDPQLTTRLVAGPNPLRVVLDPNRRLEDKYRVFRDSAAPTWLVCNEQYADDRHFGAARVIGIPMAGDSLDLAALTRRLAADGLTAIFVEGGGDTVSRFLEADLLDRLQLAVAPLVIGRGRPGLRLPAQASLANCLRADGRVFRMGRDILYDCDLRAGSHSGYQNPSGLEIVY